MNHFIFIAENLILITFPLIKMKVIINEFKQILNNRFSFLQSDAFKLVRQYEVQGLLS